MTRIPPPQALHPAPPEKSVLMDILSATLGRDRKSVV